MAILDFVFDEDKNTPRQEQLEIAKEMLSEQEPIKKVVRFTGLDLATVEELKHHLKRA